MEGTKIAIIGLAIALVLSIQFFIINDWLEEQSEKSLTSYIEGYDKGSSDTFISLFEKTQNCNLATITIGNFSRTLLDISCLEIENSNPP